jgi:hypothetical protein
VALLGRNVSVLAPPPGEPAPDRAPDELAAGTARGLRRELEELLGADRVLGRASDLIRYASDASPYRLFPQAVVMARDAADVAKVLAYGREHEIPVTFLVLQNQEYGILKWFAEAEGVSGAPGLDLPKLDVASVAEGYGVKAHRAKERDEVAGALSAALASSQPELVEVPVTPGMSLF